MRLELNGRVLIDATSATPAWLDSEPIELPFDTLPLEIHYRRAEEPARLALFWQGPQFELEPIAARWLLHDAKATPNDAFERGAELVRALRCAACHHLPGEQPALPAPALNSLAGNLSRAWLVDWLDGTAGNVETNRQDHDHRNMPHFGFTRDQCEAVADFLLSTSANLTRANPADGPVRSAIPAKKNKKDEPESAPPPPSAAQGGTLFRTLGCLACHRAGELGGEGRFGGGDLSRVARKRPADFFARWLANPTSINASHRMPIFALEPREIESLSLYLQTLGGEPGSAGPGGDTRIELGRELVRQARCGACHTMPEVVENSAIEPLPIGKQNFEESSTDSCLFEPKPAAHRPGYQLKDDERRSVTAFLTEIAGIPTAPRAHSAKQLFAEQNCLACHTRGSSQGLSSLLPKIGDADPALRDVLPALRRRR